ncbi:hypothetical protein ABI_09800 [Asticcacaulis biprosthecium C19]|uniref:Uncharacterized protein n=1 Tax=Asticcacaulis biprosthecium C19 TaxID=715226 RepID=F4QGU1_9CAUL|nr:hypothetical protein [Asticcacaulis biprosthecium]EGF92543.1 hypothetical protein ABI_09800 [Asticcacaulis biprosthecium C19]
MSARLRLIAASLVLALAAGAAQAQTPLSADQSKQLDAYMKNMGHGGPVKADRADSGHAIITPGMLQGSDVATVSAPDQRTLDNLLALSAPESEPAGLAFGVATGFGVRLNLPEVAEWDQQAGRAIVAAFENPDPNATAEQVATFAAVPAGNAAFEERVGLVRTLYRVDGTEELVRFFVSREHMKLIIQEIARHIDFNTLSETDRVRLATIAAVAQTELEDRILDLTARNQANTLTSQEVMQLIVAFDIDPQRKLTLLRLNDDGKIDRAAELDLRLAQYQIVKQFESGQ